MRPELPAFPDNPEEIGSRLSPDRYPRTSSEDPQRTEGREQCAAVVVSIGMIIKAGLTAFRWAQQLDTVSARPKAAEAGPPVVRRLAETRVEQTD